MTSLEGYLKVVGTSLHFIQGCSPSTDSFISPHLLPQPESHSADPSSQKLNFFFFSSCCLFLNTFSSFYCFLPHLQELCNLHARLKLQV